jgi:DsbC/DsbD-like thiol-disulfide interchange protein
MRIANLFIAIMMLASQAALPATGTSGTAPHVRARVVSEVSSISPGQAFWVALEFEIQDGWHTYWRNPGDSGKATTLNWQLPPGFTAGNIIWSVPERFDLPPLVNYGYARHAVHLVEITAPTGLKPGALIDLSARASWVVCSDLCVPESAIVKLKLSVGSTATIDPAQTSLFVSARNELPRPQPAPVTARVREGRLILSLDKDWNSTLPQITSLAFFPYDEGVIDYAAQQTMSRNGDVTTLTIKAGFRATKISAISGVLRAVASGDGTTIALPVEISALR